MIPAFLPGVLRLSGLAFVRVVLRLTIGSLVAVRAGAEAGLYLRSFLAGAMGPFAPVVSRPVNWCEGSVRAELSEGDCRARSGCATVGGGT